MIGIPAIIARHAGRTRDPPGDVRPNNESHVPSHNERHTRRALAAHLFLRRGASVCELMTSLLNTYVVSQGRVGDPHRGGRDGARTVADGCVDTPAMLG